MITINAQTIINQVMAAAQVAPSKDDAGALLEFKWLMNKRLGLFDNAWCNEQAHYLEEQETAQTRGEWLDLHPEPASFITFKTGAKSSHKIKNTKENLELFAGKVRVNAAAFGGGIVRTIKPRAAIVWPAKSVSLFKQLIEDRDYSAALDLAESKLGALFCINKNGRALLQVAPVPVETMPGMVSVMNEGGDFSIIEPVSMRCIPGTCKRTRNAQIEAGQRHYDTATPESKARILSEAEAMRVDQAACRAQWMAEHAIDDAQEIQARIDAQAAQDVAQVVASATAAAVIEQAQDAAALGELGTVATDTPAQAAQDAAPELETCAAMADSSATACEASSGAPGGTGGHGAGLVSACVVLGARPTGQQIKSKSGNWSARFYTGQDGRAFMDFDGGDHGRGLGLVGAWFYETGAERMRALQAMASQADKAAQDAAARLVAQVNPLIDFDDSDGVDCDLMDAVNMASAADLQSLDAAQFARLYDHLENWNFHTECVMVRALRVGAGNIAKTLRRLVALHQKTGYLTQDLSEQRAALSAEVKALENTAAQDAAGRQVAPVGVSASAATAAGTGEKMDPPANLNQNPGGYAGAESQSTGSTQAGDPPANLNRKIDDGDSGAAVVVPVGGLSITIERAEGLSSECGQPVTVGSFAEADAVLHAWSETAPSRGGYDKCDFSISWADGGTYSGRYDLKHHSKEPASLTQHMIDECEFHTGKFCPLHMSQDDYTSYLKNCVDESTAQAYGEVLQTLTALGVYFAKVRPVAVDLVKLVQAGADARRLVGQGVVYTGDRCNPSAEGAIVGIEPSQWKAGGFELAIITEDGAQHRAGLGDFAKGGAHSYRLTMKTHGAPYLAQLAATVATVKAQASAAKTQEQAAHAAALVDFAAQFPQLKRAENTYSGGKLAAVNMRILLKEAFKGCKFSVKSDYNSVRINWTDGPTTAELLDVVGRFDIGASDTQSDYFYTVSTAFSELFGGCQYLFTNRTDSPEQIASAIERLYPDASTRPSAADYIEGRGCFDWGNYNNDRARRAMREQLETMGATPPAKMASKAA